MIKAEDALAASKRRVRELKRALGELVKCKDLKDEMNILDHPMNWGEPQQRRYDLQADYDRRTPIAWATAREALDPAIDAAVGKQK